MTKVFSEEDRRAWMATLPKRPSSGSVILETEPGVALFVKANYKTYWTFPGGIIDEDEMPKQAAVREVQEEVGLNLDADAVAFKWVTSRIWRGDISYQFIFSYTLSPGQTDHIILQESEIDEWKLVSIDEILADPYQYSEAARNWADQNGSSYIEQLEPSKE